jgi:hypothetical protein
MARNDCLRPGVGIFNVEFAAPQLKGAMRHRLPARQMKMQLYDADDAFTKRSLDRLDDRLTIAKRCFLQNDRFKR